MGLVWDLVGLMHSGGTRWDLVGLGGTCVGLVWDLRMERRHSNGNFVLEKISLDFGCGLEIKL